MNKLLCGHKSNTYKDDVITWENANDFKMTLRMKILNYIHPMIPALFFNDIVMYVNKARKKQAR